MYILVDPPGFFAGCHARFQIMPQTRNSGFEASMLVVQYSTVLYSSYSRIRTASTVIQQDLCCTAVQDPSTTVLYCRSRILVHTVQLYCTPNRACGSPVGTYTDSMRACMKIQKTQILLQTEICILQRPISSGRNQLSINRCCPDNPALSGADYC